jgi:hypothetical protein
VGTEFPPSEGRPAVRGESLVTQAGLLARWATRTGADLARRLPGAAAVESELGELERRVLGELRRRLDNVDPLPSSSDAEPEEPPDTVRARTAPPPRQTEPLRVAMAELLTRSVEQTAQRAREYLYLAIVRQLLPDEARILAALADGSTFPLVHVDRRIGVAGSQRVLANASTVGRAAGVSVPAAVPRYLTRLLHLGLVATGDPDPELGVQYDILMTDPGLRAAEDAARAEGRARIVRGTVRISELGRDLWDACHPREEVEPEIPAQVPPPVAPPTPPPTDDPVAVPWSTGEEPTPVPPHLDVTSRNGSRPD